MSVDASLEAPRPVPHSGFTDSLTYSFGDRESDLYGVARLGLSPGDGDGAAPQASGLAVLFAGREPVAARAAGGIEVEPGSWEVIDAGGVRTVTETPLARWRVRFASEDGVAGFDLLFEAVSTPASIDAESDVARAGGMYGYEQLCRVTGTVRARGGDRQVDCLGQRGHSWGTPDWERLSLVRTVGAWLGDDLGVTLTTIRDRKAKHHADEAIGAALFSSGEARAILEPRLSTTYDSGGRQRRASFELYEDEEAWARRGAGEVRCGTTLDLGRLQLDCAFFAWEMDGRAGVGRYDVLRLAP